MRALARFELANLGQTRRPTTVVEVQVPCVLAPPGRGHPLRIVLAEDGTLLHLSCPCENGRVLSEAARRLEQEEFCIEAKKKFRNAMMNSDFRYEVPEGFQTRRVLIEVGREAHAAQLRHRWASPGRRISEQAPAYLHRSLATLREDWWRARIAGVLTNRINRALGWQPETLEAWQKNREETLDPPFKVGAGESRFDEEGMEKHDEPFLLAVYAPGTGSGAYPEIGRLFYEKREGPGFYRFVPSDEIKIVAKRALLNKKGFCLCCSHKLRTFTNRTRHGAGPRHVARFLSLVRVIDAMFKQDAQRVSEVHHARRESRTGDH